MVTDNAAVLVIIMGAVLAAGLAVAKAYMPHDWHFHWPHRRH